MEVISAQDNPGKRYFLLLYKTNNEKNKIKAEKAIIATFAMIAFYSYSVQSPEYKFQI